MERGCDYDSFVVFVRSGDGDSDDRVSCNRVEDAACLFGQGRRTQCVLSGKHPHRRHRPLVPVFMVYPLII